MQVSCLMSNKRAYRNSRRGNLIQTALLVLSLSFAVPAHARVLWETDSFSIDLGVDFSCSDEIALRVQASSAVFYERELDRLGEALGSGLAPLVFECATLSRAQISGFVGPDLVFDGYSVLENGWQISALAYALEAEVQALDRSITTVADLLVAAELKDRLQSIPGASDTFATFLYEQTLSQVLARVLTQESVADIRRTVAESFARNRSEAEARRSVDPILALIEQVVPQSIAAYRDAVAEELGLQVNNAWAQLIGELDAIESGGPEILSELVRRANALPLPEAAVASVDRDVSQGISAQANSLAQPFQDSSPEAVSDQLSSARMLLSLSVADELSQTQQTLNALSLRIAATVARNAAAEEFNSTQSAEQARALINPLLLEIERVEPSRLDEVRSEVQQAIAVEAQGLWQALLDELYLRGDVFGEAVELIADRSKSLPISNQTLAEIDHELAAWVAEEVAIYELLFQEDFAVDIAERLALAEILVAHDVSLDFVETQATLTGASLRLASQADEALQSLVDNAVELIEVSGQSHLDVVDVLETGLAVSAELESAGFADQSQLTIEATNSHVERLLSEGLEAVRSDLLASDMGREATQLFREEADVYSELSPEFAAFNDYAIAIEEGIAAGRLRACQTHANEAVRNGAHLQDVVVAARGTATISELACDLYRNGHILRSYRPRGPFRNATLMVDRADGSAEIYQLERSEDGLGLLGITVEVGSEERVELDQIDWLARITALTIPPPSGVPNAQGVTECDLLAGDPSDPASAAEGVDLLQLPEDYDIERAINACIAALEHDPSQVRFYHQLARILDFVGAAEDADEPLQLALEANYAPSQFIAAERAMLEEDEDAFFDAIDLLEASAADGYPPAEALLGELIPPGMDFFRPLPTPTDDQILDSLGRTECTPAVMGMRTCVTRTGVASKDCFQTGERTFSCEVRVRFSCRMQGGDALMSMIIGAACPANSVSEPMFRDLVVR